MIRHSHADWPAKAANGKTFAQNAAEGRHVRGPAPLHRGSAQNPADTHSWNKHDWRDIRLCFVIVLVITVVATTAAGWLS